MGRANSDDHDASRPDDRWEEPIGANFERRDPAERDVLIAECQRMAERVRPLYDNGDLLKERLGEPGIWLLVGLPSAGKSTLAEAIRGVGRMVVEIDEIRAENGWALGQDEWRDDAYEIAYERLAAALERGVVFESTGLWAAARHWCLRETRTRNVPARAIVIGTDARTCSEREERRRGRGHPFFVAVLGAYIETIEALPHEGYDSVHWMDEEEQRRIIDGWR